MAWKRSPTEAQWWNALVKRMGSQEKAAETMAKFNDMIAHSKIELVRYTKKPWE